MSLLTSIADGILGPEIGEPPVRTVEKAGVTMQVSQLFVTTTSHDFSIPVIVRCLRSLDRLPFKSPPPTLGQQKSP